MTTKKPIFYDFLVLAAGGAAAVVSMVASLTSLPSALAADLRFFSSVEATVTRGSGAFPWPEELKIKAFWEDDEAAREGAKPSMVEATLNGSDFMDLLWDAELLDFFAAFEENQFRLQSVVLKQESWIFQHLASWDRSAGFLFNQNGIIRSADPTNVSFDSNIRQQQPPPPASGGARARVAEPSLTLGFITLASLMLGSRKKKEAKKT